MGLKTVFLCFLINAKHCFGEDRYNFRCQPRPGCNFTHCLPPPKHFFEIEGFDVDEFMKINEYNILCDSNITTLDEHSFEENEYILECHPRQGCDLVHCNDSPDHHMQCKPSIIDGSEGFACKPASSCDFSKCDPIPSEFKEMEGFDVELYRRTRDYQIRCRKVPNSRKMNQTEKTELEKRLGETQSELSNVKDRLKEMQDELFRTKDKLEKTKNQLEYSKEESRKQNQEILRLHDEKDDLTIRLNSLQKVNNQLNSSLAVSQKSPNFRKVSFGNKLFWAIVRDGKDMNYHQALASCKKEGGFPSNIYSECHQEMLRSYVSSLIPEAWLGIGLWLGLTYDPLTKIPRYSNGTRSLYNPMWYPYYPFSMSDFTQIVLFVQKDVNSIYKGIGNASPTLKSYGVLCEI